jgi:hypothetical protein
MPICVICGNDVTKRKSLAYDNGRACRIHEKMINKVNEDKLAIIAKDVESKLRILMATNSIIMAHKLGMPLLIVMRKIFNHLSKYEQKEVKISLSKELEDNLLNEII